MTHAFPDLFVKQMLTLTARSAWWYWWYCLQHPVIVAIFYNFCLFLRFLLFCFRQVLPKSHIEVLRKPSAQVLPQLSTFNFERHRRLTFATWPKKESVSPRALAEAGFIYILGILHVSGNQGACSLYVRENCYDYLDFTVIMVWLAWIAMYHFSGLLCYSTSSISGSSSDSTSSGSNSSSSNSSSASNSK